MAAVCEVCGKRPSFGMSISRLPPADQAALESEHPACEGRRGRHHQAHPRLHLVHTRREGHQSRPLGLLPAAGFSLSGIPGPQHLRARADGDSIAEGPRDEMLGVSARAVSMPSPSASLAVIAADSTQPVPWAPPPASQGPSSQYCGTVAKEQVRALAGFSGIEVSALEQHGSCSEAREIAPPPTFRSGR